MSKEHISYFLQTKRLEEQTRRRAKYTTDNQNVLTEKQNLDNSTRLALNSSGNDIRTPRTVFES